MNYSKTHFLLSYIFFCFDYISIISGSKKLSHVDHFFPHTLKYKNFIGYVDGIWNLVLACQKCNNGQNGKFAQLPSKELLKRLHKRNEYKNCKKSNRERGS